LFGFGEPAKPCSDFGVGDRCLQGGGDVVAQRGRRVERSLLECGPRQFVDETALLGRQLADATTVHARVGGP
jgi:hypothetical protein